MERLLRPADLPVPSPISRRCPSAWRSFSGARISADPGLIQAGTLMTMIIPIVLFLIFQRLFIRGIVITGVEK